MKHIMAAAVAGIALAGAQAQAQSTDISGITALNERIDDIQRDVAIELQRGEDANRFGNPEFRPGLSGSASLGFSGQTGNSDTREVLAGARLRYAAGRFVQTIGFAADFASEDGDSTTEDLFAVYDANYYFNDKFYGFILGRVETDGLAETADEIGTDAFIGVGPGYRIINTEKVTWRVQAGLGQSFLKDGTGDSTSELGGIVSSRLFYGISPTISITDDTDVLKTDSALRVNNDLGVNFKMSDALATRVSYLTEYNDSRAIRADNRLGVSLVLGF